MPFSEEIVKTSYSALLECNIVKYNIDGKYTISENYDNKISDFLTMLHYYELPLAVWNFNNGRYESDKCLSLAVLKVVAKEELLRHYCPMCEKNSCTCDCEKSYANYTSLRNFVETKDAMGQRWLALDLIEMALTILKNTTAAYPQVETEKESKIYRPTSTELLHSPDLQNLKKVNLGQFFYNEYYPKIFEELDLCNTSYFINQNNLLCSLDLAAYDMEIQQFIKDQKLKHQSRFSHLFSFLAKTKGDGFFCGAGIPHDFGFPRFQNQNNKDSGELLLGMFFDQTSGLPVLPGESIKGTLRKAFEEYPEIVFEILQELKITFINHSKINIEDIEVLLNDIFNNPAKSDENDRTPETFFRDEFLTSFPISTNNAQGKFLGIDYITANDGNPLKNPQASIPFLKVLPNVVYQFNLVLVDSLINKTEKLKLIKRLINEFGLGAKSRKGFGKFEFVKDIKY